nr:LOW QUALITY PROTEIN: uncharacterized protein LOC106845491 [Equus asinus]
MRSSLLQARKQGFRHRRMHWTPRGGARAGAGGRTLRAARTIKWDARPPAHALKRMSEGCVFKRRSHPPPPRLDVSSGTGAAPPSILEPGLGWSTTPAPFRLQVLSPGLEQPHRPSVLWPRPQASVPLPPGAPVAMAEGALAPTEVGRGDRRYTHTELLAVSQRFQQNPSELLITWVLRVYDQGGSALTLSPGELTLLGDLTSDTVFNYRCKALRGGRQPLLTWLLLAWRQRWESFLHFNSTELPFQPWTTMEEGIQLVRELGMLDWIYSELPLPATPEDVPFTPGLQQRLLTAAPSEARVSLVDLLVQGMTVLEAVMKIQAIADVGLLWRHSQPGGAKLVLGPNPTHKDLLGWLLSHGVPRERVDKQPTKVLMELYIREARRSRGHPARVLGDKPLPPPPLVHRN